MSRFLGPIHFWLHNKIQIHDSLEIQWQKQMLSKGLITDEINEQLFTYDDVHDAPNPEESLEQSIDTNNIHGWLQQRITKSETRFAAKLSYLIKTQGDVALKEAESVYASYGKTCGETVRESDGDIDLGLAYKQLNNYVLEGMPCDNVGAVTEQDDDHLTWIATRCLHKGYWEAVNGDVANYHVLRDAFNTAYFKALGNFTYDRKESGDGSTYTIRR